MLKVQRRIFHFYREEQEGKMFSHKWSKIVSKGARSARIFLASPPPLLWKFIKEVQIFLIGEGKLYLLIIKRTLPRSTNARGKLLSALSAIAALSAGTLQNLCTFLGRVPALGAAMTESALSNFKRLSWSRGASLIFQQTRGDRGEWLGQQERGDCGEGDQGLILSFGKSVQHKKCHIFYAD